MNEINVVLKQNTINATLSQKIVNIVLGKGIPGPPGIGDKTYAQSFNDAEVVIVSHNLAKYPAITVVDSAGTVVIGDITYNSNSQITVTFTASFSGTIYCN